MTGARKNRSIAVLAVFVLVLAVTWWKRDQDARRVEDESRIAAAQRPLPVHNLARVEQSRPRLPDNTTPVAQPKAATDDAGDDGSTDWAVIAATYREYDDAEQRASELRRQMAGCACSVYPARGEGSRYYVLLGSGFRRPDAYRVRERALVAGLPADTYVTRIDRSQTRARSADSPR